MKKVLMFLVLCLFPICVSAKEYNIDDVYLKISLDDNWYVFTRDNIKDNEDLQKFGVDEEYMEKMLKSNNVYIDAMSKDNKTEFIVIIPTTTGINNLANYPDKMLENDMIPELKNKLSSSTNDIKAEVKTINGYKYIKMSFYDSNVKRYVYKYYTVINSKGYNFQIQEATKIEDEKVLDDIIKTVEIKVLNPKESSKMQKEIDKYNKKDSGIWTKVLIGAIVGAIIGAIGSIINRNKKINNN